MTGTSSSNNTSLTEISKRHCGPLPLHIWRCILGPTTIIDQLKFQRVSRLLQSAPPLMDVDLDEVRQHLAAESLNKPKDELESGDVLVICGAQLGTVDRVVCVRSGINQELSPQYCQRLAATFPSCKFLRLPNCSVQINSLEHFANIKSIHIGTLSPTLGRGSLSAGCVDLLNRLTRLIISLDALRSIEAGGNGRCRIPGLLKLCLSDPRGCLMKKDVDFVKDCFVNLTMLQVETGYTRLQLADYRAFGHLTKLSLRGSFRHPAGGTLNNPVPWSLEVFSLRSRGVTEFSFLQALPRLRRLDVQGTRMKLSDLEWLGPDIGLTHVNVSYCKLITDDLIEFLIDRKYPIEVLVAASPLCCPGFTSTAVRRYLEWTPSLKILGIRSNRRVDNGIFNSGITDYLKRLELLDVRGITNCDGGGISQLFAKRGALRRTGVQLPKMVVYMPLGRRPAPQVCSEMRSDGLAVESNYLPGYHKHNLGF